MATNKNPSLYKILTKKAQLFAADPAGSLRKSFITLLGILFGVAAVALVVYFGITWLWSLGATALIAIAVVTTVGSVVLYSLFNNSQIRENQQFDPSELAASSASTVAYNAATQVPNNGFSYVHNIANYANPVLYNAIYKPAAMVGEKSAELFLFGMDKTACLARYAAENAATAVKDGFTYCGNKIYSLKGQ